MGTSTINYYGQLFDNPTITPAIARAANIAKSYGVALIHARTPVDTGLLKNSWKAKLEGNGIRYTNEAPYAGFVEFGTRKMTPRSMMTDSLPDIQEVFIEELYSEIGAALGAEIANGGSSRPGYGTAVNPNPKYPSVGSNVQPAIKSGLSKRDKKTSKNYLFANPAKILSDRNTAAIGQAKPLWQKKPNK